MKFNSVQSPAPGKAESLAVIQPGSAWLGGSSTGKFLGSVGSERRGAHNALAAATWAAQTREGPGDQNVDYPLLLSTC